MTSIIMLRKRWQNLENVHAKTAIFKHDKKESNIRAPVLLNLLNLLQKSD